MFFIVVAVLLVSVFLIYGSLPLFKLTEIPGPPRRMFFGNLKELTTLGEKNYLIGVAKKFPKLALIMYGQEPRVFIFDSELLKEVLSSGFRRVYGNRPIPPVDLGSSFMNNIGFQEVNRWQSSRRMLNQAFDPNHLVSFATIFNKLARGAVRTIEKSAKEDGYIEIYQLFSEMSSNSVMRTMFSGSPLTTEGFNPKEFKDSMMELTQIFSVAATKTAAVGSMFPVISKILKQIPFGKLHDIRKAMKIFSNELLPYIRREREKTDIEKSVKDMSMFSHFIHTHDPDTGVVLSESEILANAQIMVLAGFITTSLAMSFMLYHLSKNPDIEKRLVEEINSFVDPDKDISYFDLKKMKYFDWVTKETLRILPPGLIVVRETMKETVLGGYKVPSKTPVNIFVWAYHHNPKQFPNPSKFIPERFDPESEEFKKRPSNVFIPFGEGPRICIAKKMAFEQVKIVIAHIIRKYTFTLSPKTQEPLKLQDWLFLRILDGIFLVPHLRNKQT